VHLVFSTKDRRPFIRPEIEAELHAYLVKGREYTAFSWQGGYGAFSIGQSNVAALKRYIAEQKDRHKRVSFQDEFRALLTKYRIEYDERYVWD